MGSLQVARMTAVDPRVAEAARRDVSPSARDASLQRAAAESPPLSSGLYIYTEKACHTQIILRDTVSRSNPCARRVSRRLGRLMWHGRVVYDCSFPYGSRCASTIDLSCYPTSYVSGTGELRLKGKFESLWELLDGICHPLDLR